MDGLRERRGVLIVPGDMLAMLDELTQVQVHVAIIRGPILGEPVIVLESTMYHNEQRSKARIQQLRHSHNCKSLKR